jgi:hypothetical protein
MMLDEPPHGTRARYQGNRSRPPCRCDECRSANREYGRAYRRDHGIRTRPESLIENRKPSPIDGQCPIEGRCRIASRSLYVKGCRGDACTRENRDYMRGWLGIWQE